jgi:hypothetical protein
MLSGAGCNRLSAGWPGLGRATHQGMPAWTPTGFAAAAVVSRQVQAGLVEAEPHLKGCLLEPAANQCLQHVICNTRRTSI